MAENPDRLHLIQRAIKRLNNQDDAPPAARAPRDIPPPSVPLEPPPGAARFEPTLSAAELANGYGASTALQQRAAAARVVEDTAPAAAGRRVRLKFSELRKNGMITPDNMSSTISHEYRSIKRKLLNNARDPKSRAVVNNLVMITSALPGEGKTFTAINMALSLAAERDLHVLLVDGDVIHPSVYGVFERTDGTGLVDLLNGNAPSISDVLYRCDDVPNLSVIFAGKPERGTPELVSSRRMADLCLDISTRYNDRIIIIDTPPVLASSEPANMAMHVHQIVMVVAASQTDRTQLQSALESISSCRNVSLLFNKAPAWHQIDGDPYYQYYSGDRAARN